MTVSVILAIIVAHWFADFVCQTNYMALNKHHSNKALGLHVLTYIAVMGLAAQMVTGPRFQIIEWMAVNFILHFITDYLTSRLNGLLWTKQQRYLFFVSVGFDQVIHYACLFLTLNYFEP